MSDFDIVMVGAGHNGLVCAGYLAKAGYSVGIVERRHKVGGAVVTEEHVPGYLFDLGGSAHMLINHMPIVDDLKLTDYGLAYVNCDPIFFAPFPDGSHIMVYQDVDKTCESIAAISPEDAVNYRNFIDEWTPFAEAMVDAFKHPPVPGHLFKKVIMESGLWKRLATAGPMMARGYGRILRKTFKDERVQAVVAWMAAQSGPPPNEMMAAPLALWQPNYHTAGVKRPIGGSGMLTQALKHMIEDHGGKVFVDNPVCRILTSGGRAIGVEAADGTRLLAKKAVVSAAHVQTTLRLLKDDVPQRTKDKIDNKLGNGMGMIVRYAMDELPNYTALPTVDGQPGPQHMGLQFICPTMDYLDHAYADFKRGEVSKNPALAIMTVSAPDPSLAPPGKHVMYLWGQYFPYELASGEHWDDVGKREADRMLTLMAEYAPNVVDAVIGELIETPLYLERELGLVRGHIMHMEMRGDQMFMLRPALSMGSYRGPVDGLYLTGASTHPGGGIMGAAGRNAATVIRHDLEKRRWWQGLAAR